MIVNFVVLYNCAMITMNLCYDIDPKGAYKYISDFCEVMFGLDILFQFVQEYKDSETQQPVREINQIAKNYVMRGSFLIDFLAIIPIDLVMPSQYKNLNKMLRMIRITRMFKLLDIARFNHLLKSFFENDSSQDKIML